MNIIELPSSPTTAALVVVEPASIPKITVFLNKCLDQQSLLYALLCLTVNAVYSASFLNKGSIRLTSIVHLNLALERRLYNICYINYIYLL